MIDDNELFFRTHKDAETRRRGLFIVQCLDGLRRVIQSTAPTMPVVIPPPKPTTLRDAQLAAIMAALINTKGRISPAARLLKIGRTTLYHAITEYDLGVWLKSLSPKTAAKCDPGPKSSPAAPSSATP